MLSRKTLATQAPKDVPLTVWKKLPNIFFSFVGVLVCPPKDVDLPKLILNFPWSKLVPHGYAFRPAPRRPPPLR